MRKSFVVTGASSGLGYEIADQLDKRGFQVFNWSKETGVDVTDPASLDKAAHGIYEQHDAQIDGLINCAGINYINWFMNIPLEKWDEVMNTNAKGIFLATRALMARRLLHSKSLVCNIISNASHMPMTHSAVYNASKGAAHILTLQMGRELKKTHGFTVFGVSPNKLKGTGMSNTIESAVCELRGWTKEQAQQYQLAALPAGEETDPKACAEFIVFLITQPHINKFLNCTVLPFGA